MRYIIHLEILCPICWCEYDSFQWGYVVFSCLSCFRSSEMHLTTTSAGVTLTPTNSSVIYLFNERRQKFGVRFMNTEVNTYSFVIWLHCQRHRFDARLMNTKTNSHRFVIHFIKHLIWNVVVLCNLAKMISHYLSDNGNVCRLYRSHHIQNSNEDLQKVLWVKSNNEKYSNQ